MGRFSDLRPDQKDFLIRVTTAAQQDEDGSFLWVAHAGGAALLGNKMNLQNVPDSRTFYLSLAERGYLTVCPTSDGNDLHLYLSQKAFDYAAYAEKGWLGQWWADLVYELGHEDTLRAKLIWAVLTVLVTTLVVKVLTVAGMI
jgi:hypothetical protein